ncbi:MAG TPA: YfhO family protein [Aggregatilineaceae bacterium]|nr:YfhO family protein [Aggregatilineaceae bacterium]
MQRFPVRILIIPLVLAALTLIYMMPFVRSPTGREMLDGHDLVDQQYPLLSLIFDSVRDGHGLPLWNPYLFAGQSIVANPQSTLYYPPAWIMVPLGVPRGVGWLIAVHLGLGAWGMAQFARRLGSSLPGALIGGIVYEFSALLGAHLEAGHLNYLLCQAWLPWIASAYLWAVDQRRWPWAGLPGAAALGLCILTGYPPLLYFAFIWLGSLWLYVALQAPAGDRLRAAGRALRPLLVILLGGAILGAALLLPVGQFTLRSTRTQDSSLAFSNSYALPGGQLVTLLFPNVFGWPRLPDLGYWGLPFYEEVTAYVGILPLMAVFLMSRFSRRPGVRLLLIFVIVGLVVSLGIDGGLFPPLYWLLPGYSIFRVPSRALYFVVVGAAGLTALLFTELPQMTVLARVRLLGPVLRRLLPLLMIFALSSSVALTVYFTAHSTDQEPPWRVLYSGSMAGLALVALGAAWVVLRLWRSAGPQPGMLAITGLVLLIDLWHISQPLVTVSAVDVPPLWKSMARVAPGSPDYRIMTVPDTIGWQAGATYTRHLNASGYDPLVSDAYQRLLDASQHNPTSPVSRLLGVRYAVSDKPYEWLNLPGSDALTLRTQADGWYIYEVHDPLPRVFLASSIQVSADDAAILEQIAAGTIDPRTAVVVDRPVNCPSSSAENIAPQITGYEPNSVDVEAAGPGILVLTDSYDPNWTVAVDGVQAELLRVDTALRGVCLGEGAHRVHFAFQPAIFRIGVLISLAGWIAVVLLALIWLVRRRF